MTLGLARHSDSSSSNVKKVNTWLITDSLLALLRLARPGEPHSGTSRGQVPNFGACLNAVLTRGSDLYSETSLRGGSSWWREKAHSML